MRYKDRRITNKMQSRTNLASEGIQMRAKFLASQKWEDLTENQKLVLQKIWGVLTYKWKWQIAMNLPYLAIFLLDRTIPAVHKFDMALLSSITSNLPIPESLLKLIGVS